MTELFVLGAFPHVMDLMVPCCDGCTGHVVMDVVVQTAVPVSAIVAILMVCYGSVGGLPVMGVVSCPLPRLPRHRQEN